MTVQNEGRRNVKRKIEFYNLDVIISVGYRVKSKQGTKFRIWASGILKDYLLKGYSINNRLNKLEDKYDILHNKVNEIDLQINSNLIPNQGIFFEGQVFDAYEFTSKLIRSAKFNIILIDNYINETTLIQLSKKQNNVKVLLLTKSINKEILLDVKKVNEQYGNFEIKSFDYSHDRFLIIDNKELYHIGASLKDLGKKLFAFSKLELHFLDSILNKINQ